MRPLLHRVRRKFASVKHAVYLSVTTQYPAYVYGATLFLCYAVFYVALVLPVLYWTPLPDTVAGPLLLLAALGAMYPFLIWAFTASEWAEAGFPVKSTSLRAFLRHRREAKDRQASLALRAKRRQAEAKLDRDAEQVKAMREQYLELGERLAERSGMNTLRATFQAHEALESLLSPLSKDA